MRRGAVFNGFSFALFAHSELYHISVRDIWYNFLVNTRKLYVATLADDSAEVIKDTNLGIESDHYAWASMMYGDRFALTEEKIRNDFGFVLENHKFTVPSFIHAPFNELHPAAIDDGVKQIAYKRYEDIYRIARSYGINNMVVHSGYLPFVYIRSWHVKQSADFWQEYTADKPKLHIYIENVLEEEPDIMAEVIDAIANPNIKLCIDVGHIACMSETPPEEWIRILGSRIGHFHLHSNDGKSDMHLPLGEGVVDAERVLDSIGEFCPDASITLESRDAGRSVRYLRERRSIK